MGELQKIRKHDLGFDKLEAVLFENFKPVDCPVRHDFINGVYFRTIFMPKGTKVTSLIHKTKHSFFVSQGKVKVYSENDGVQMIEAPYKGTTMPGTRRILFVQENTFWTTRHETNIVPENDSKEAVEKAVKLIEEQIIEKHENEFLRGAVKNNILITENEKNEVLTY